MSKLTLCLLFLFLYSAAEANPAEVRALCIEKTTQRCLEQCQKTNDINCSPNCNDIAINQCRQAGE